MPVSPPKLPVIIVLLLLFINGRAIEDFPVKDCEGLSINYQASSTNSAKTSFRVSLQARGGHAPYHYILMDSKDNIVSHDQSKNTFEKLQKGTYQCVVIDGRNCRKDLNFELK